MRANFLKCKYRDHFLFINRGVIKKETFLKLHLIVRSNYYMDLPPDNELISIHKTVKFRRRMIKMIKNNTEFKRIILCSDRKKYICRFTFMTHQNERFYTGELKL